VRAVHFEEQLLLVLTLPCSVSPPTHLLLRSSPLPTPHPSSLSLFRHHSGSPRDPLPLLLPWSCALSLNSSTQEHTAYSSTQGHTSYSSIQENIAHSSTQQFLPLQGVSAGANLVFIRCVLPERAPQAPLSPCHSGYHFLP